MSSSAVQHERGPRHSTIHRHISTCVEESSSPTAMTTLSSGFAAPPPPSFYFRSSMAANAGGCTPGDVLPIASPPGLSNIVYPTGAILPYTFNNQRKVT